MSERERERARAREREREREKREERSTTGNRATLLKRQKPQKCPQEA